MRKIKDVLRLKLDAKLSHEQIAGSLGLSKGVVTKYVGLAAAAAGLTWPEIHACDDVSLERRLLVVPERPRTQVQPDYGRVHHELRRKGMTLMLLWEEYQADHVDSHTTATLNIARNTGSLPNGSNVRCGKFIAPARNCSSISPAPPLR